MAPFVAEVVASGLMGAALNSLGGAAFLLGPKARDLGAEAYLPAGIALEEALPIGLMFGWLAFFFSGPFAWASRGSVMNPCVLVLQRAAGGIGTGELVKGLLAVVLGTTLGVIAVREAFLASGIPELHPAAVMKPITHSVDSQTAAAAEAAVAAIVLMFGSFVAPLFGAFGGVVTAAFYCAVFIQEKCTYTCTVMNPAAILALHIASLQDLGAARQVLLGPAVWESMAPYWGGACAGGLAVGLVLRASAWLFKPKTKRD